MNQEFNGPISGGTFVGRDVNMMCTGIDQCPHLIDEAHRQKLFEERTEIRDCPRKVRETFLRLMEDFHFSKEQLRAAWNYRVLTHDNGCIKLEPSQVNFWHAVYVIIAMFAVWLVTSIFFLLSRHDITHWAAWLGVSLIFVLAIFGYDRTEFSPRRAAKKVMVALSNIEDKPDKDK
ncbi:MAG: hypothetical protein FWH15_06350 [Betaproteobacteria bacterium]|nr:hypothetical protein [Betaproteobacteria bacterium]